MKTIQKLINKNKVILFVLLFFVCFQTNVPEALAAVTSIDSLNQEIENQGQPQPRSTNLWLDTVKLIMILALIVTVAWFIIRIFSKQAQNKMQGRFLRVADEVTLGQNRGIVLCTIDTKMYAIGVTDNSINLLFEVEDAELIKSIIDMENEDSSKVWPKDPTKLTRQWKKVSNRIFKTPPTVQHNFHELMENQLHRLKGYSANETIKADKEGIKNGDNS